MHKRHRRHADAARGAVDEHPFAGLQARLPHQRVIGGLEADAERRAVFEGHGVGHLEDDAGVDHGLLGKGAGFHAGEHAIAEREIGRARFDHLARAFHAGDEGHRRLVLVLALGHQQIGKIDARRMIADAHLAVGERRRAADRRSSGRPDLPASPQDRPHVVPHFCSIIEGANPTIVEAATVKCREAE